MKDVIHEANVLSGIEPDLRRAWEELLSDEERSEIATSIKEGRSVADPDLAAIAVGRAVQDKRRARWFYVLIPGNFALAALWAWLLCRQAEWGSALCWLWTVAAVGWATWVPMKIVGRYRNLARSIELNRQLLDRR